MEDNFPSTKTITQPKFEYNNAGIFNYPCLKTAKQLKPEFSNVRVIYLSANNVTLGRSLDRTVIIPFISISRNHCRFYKEDENDWFIEDNSAFGISLNGSILGKGVKKKLCHDDVIKLEPSGEFVYRFLSFDDDFETPTKRIKLENNISHHDVKVKFEESQSFEIKHHEEKIQNVKQMQNASKILKEQLEVDMSRKLQKLKDEYALQIENLKGEKEEVEQQKLVLMKERDVQLVAVKEEMGEKITELMEQIKKHSEAESELLQENSSLKEKLLKDREEFLAELNRASSSKQELLNKLEEKMREQEEVRLAEKKELEEMLLKATEQLKFAKEKEFELEEQKKQKELELAQELEAIKKNLQEKVEQSEQEKRKAEEMLNQQLEEMKKLSAEEKAKLEKIEKEREEIQKKLNEAQTNADKSMEELKKKINEREIELASLAAERIQQQAEQSGEVISSLQEQLEQVRYQLQSVETEKNILLENICNSDPGEGSSKHGAVEEMGDLVENEMQCSICAELFISAVTLNCSHTFCKYCIATWKKKKKDCPICRASITSECRSLVIDSFIDKMAGLSEERKKKREELLKAREELESGAEQYQAGTSRRSGGTDDSDPDSASDLDEEVEEEEEYEDYNNRYIHAIYSSDEDEDGLLDSDSDTGVPNSTGDGDGNARRRSVSGVPGSYYGGYGRCFNCGSRGHWAPGCPFR